MLDRVVASIRRSGTRVVSRREREDGVVAAGTRFDSWTRPARTALPRAQRICQERGYREILPVLLLAGVLDQDGTNAHQLVRWCEIEPAAILIDAMALVPRRRRKVTGHVPLARETIQVIDAAGLRSASEGTPLGTEHLLVSLVAASTDLADFFSLRQITADRLGRLIEQHPLPLEPVDA